MVLLSFKKCKNYKQQLSHSAEKYQDTEITMLHWDVSNMKNVVKEKFQGMRMTHTFLCQLKSEPKYFNYITCSAHTKCWYRNIRCET